MMEGYLEARKIDATVGEIFREHGITEENAMEWLKLTRAIRTSMEVVDQMAMDVINKQTEKLAMQVSGNKDGYE